MVMIFAAKRTSYVSLREKQCQTCPGSRSRSPRPPYTLAVVRVSAAISASLIHQAGAENTRDKELKLLFANPNSLYNHHRCLSSFKKHLHHQEFLMKSVLNLVSRAPWLVLL